MMPTTRPLIVLAALTLACAPRVQRPDAAAAARPALDAAAQEYVKLVLAVGEHDEAYVDAYYGPAEWREQVKAQPPSLEAIRTRATTLLSQPALQQADDVRGRWLRRHLESLVARVDLLDGRPMSFDEEARLLYDTDVPRVSQAQLDAWLAEVDAALPGEGALPDRYDAFRRQFEIPADRVDPVFSTAIAVCRERTARHVALPQGESFTLEYVKDKPWSGYNWYQGDFKSLIQLNVSLPIHIDRAIDVACHEGYPGHHVFNALMEQHLVRELGWVEFTVYPLYSPASLIAEGTAEYGTRLVFPSTQDRIEYERTVLFPLAGLEPSAAERFHRVGALLERLEHASIEAARGRLDEGWDTERTKQFLMRYRLMTAARAEQQVRFIDTYRSYIINYTVGEQRVAHHVAAVGGDDVNARWNAFVELLSVPTLPSQLKGM